MMQRRSSGGDSSPSSGFLLERRLRLLPALAVLLVGLLVLGGAAIGRGTEYDEDYSIFLAAGTPRPVWPAGVFTAGSARHFFAGHSTPAGIARDLRETDVHPPLYFWTFAGWRAVAGTGLLTTRMFSVLASLAAVLCVGAIARLTGVAPVAAMLLTIGCYGFSYTGSVARGFALAQLLDLGGVALVVLAERSRRLPTAFAGGVLLGLASFTNYLTVFVAAAALLWLLVRQPREIGLWVVAGLGFALLLPADLWFFAAQRDSRVGQFPPFALLPALLRLARYSVANVFGGLPLYYPGLTGRLVGVGVGAAFLNLAAAVFLRWRRIGVPGAALLFLFGLLAMPVGLLLLGFVFDNTPIELRYIAFAMPFAALLGAGALASLSNPRLRVLLFGVTFAIQTVSLLGMAIRPETMQPQRAAAHAATRLAAGDPGAVVLLPRGDDGVGVVAAFISEAPDDLRLLVVGPTDAPADIRARVGDADRAVLVNLGLDPDSRAALPRMLAAFASAPCWEAAGGAVYRRKARGAAPGPHQGPSPLEP